MKRWELITTASALTFALSCTGADTAVRLSLTYDDAWELSALEVAVDGRRARVDAAHEVLVLVDDAWVAEDITIDIVGLRGDERYAVGRVSVTPELDAEVRAEAVLTRLVCGDWCVEGARACRADGVMSCERMPDGCLRWSAAVACPTVTPWCSLGTCDVDCVDECADGDTRCAGPVGAQRCGQADGDPCLDWLTVSSCPDGGRCENGRCASECTGECQVGAVRCQDGGLSSCGDRDLDGCLEWGPTEPCAADESCDGGACVPIDACVDRCTGDACDGTSLTRCGNYDLDPCLEPSPGVSCLPADPCFEATCTPSGCETAPRRCAEPPASQCIDEGTLRVYDGTGLCVDGGCEYAYREQECPNCPACDACAGVSCTSPPSACFLPSGTCTDGACSYGFANGIACDDGDACTDGDTCASGACAGTPRACASPPPATCVDATTLRTFMAPGACSAGACSYTHADTACSGGCETGACMSDCVDVWARSTIESQGSPMAPSVAIDAAGALHVAYNDDTGDDLRYAYRAAGASVWTRNTVDAAGRVGGDPSIFVDDVGGVHISHYDDTNEDLKYSYRPAGGTWTTSTVESAGTVGLRPSMAVDATRGVHIVYADFTDTTLNYAYRPRGGAWTTTVVASAYVEETALAIDGLGNLHTVYYDLNTHDLEYALRPPGGTWTTHTVDSTGDVGDWCSIAVDRSGGVHIGYYDGTNGDLKYAYRAPGGGWATTVVDSGGDVGAGVAIAADASDAIYIAYMDSTNENLRFAYRSSSGPWGTSTIDSGGSVGWMPTLAVDSSDRVHISYVDTTNADLDLAVGSICR